MIANQFDSGLMLIEISGSRIIYALKPHPEHEYEIRGVSMRDLALLRSTIGSTRLSSSESIQWLTHQHKDAHYHRGTLEIAKPSAVKRHKLKRTPWSGRSAA